MNRNKIRNIFIGAGFTIKEGQTDLKEYVYVAAYRLAKAMREECKPKRVWINAPSTSDPMNKFHGTLGYATPYGDDERFSCAFYTLSGDLVSLVVPYRCLSEGWPQHLAAKDEVKLKWAVEISVKDEDGDTVYFATEEGAEMFVAQIWEDRMYEGKRLRSTNIREIE